MQEEEKKIIDKVIYVNRVAKVVKGGRKFKFTAIVSVGDENGKVGVGLGKSAEVSSAIKKALTNGKKQLISFPLIGTTIPHEITGVFGGAKVLLKPARKGTGLIAGGAVRAVLEVSGVKDVFTKSLKSNTSCNVAMATLDGLKKLKYKEKIEELRKQERLEK